jgi:hypothetical protein
MDTGGYFPVGKEAGHEANYSSPSNTKVKKMWIYKSTPPYTFITLCLIS